MSVGKIVLRGIASLAALALLAAAVWVGDRTWPRPLPAVDRPSSQQVVLYGNRVALRVPADTLAAEVATFPDRMSAYLNDQYLSTAPPVRGARVLLSENGTPGGPVYRLYILVDNDLLRAVPYLESLVASRLISGFELLSATSSRVSVWERQTALVDAAYHGRVHRRLETLSAGQLLPPLVRFLRFKARTDPRVIAGAQPVLLTVQQARVLAGDIVRVAKFYDLPLDFFLGIGAMENNYMNVTGDLAHTVWKRHRQKGDIVLKRRHGRVLVLNNSLGVWQITRETLRYAHALYRRDPRDYAALPAALRPPRRLDLDRVNPRTLTTYAGLLFRDLLDRFHGNVRLAVGAYNGGIQHPDLDYAAGVETVASYARRVLEHSVLPVRKPLSNPQIAAASWQAPSSAAQHPAEMVAKAADRMSE